MRMNWVIASMAMMCLSGCSAGGLLDGKSSIPSATVVPVGNQLALPPDLALRAPSNTLEGYQPNGTPPAIADQSVAAAPTLYGDNPTAAGRPLPGDDVFAKYGISKTNADGSAKTAQQLNKELAAAYKAEKRRQNPNYGTIYNIGEIFSDG